MILVTGGNGQLATCLKNILPENSLFPSKEVLDITNKEQVSEFLKNKNVSTLINCAAFTQVDLCESNEELAFKVNRDGPKNLAELCNEFEIKLIHISTDYVFDGNVNTPYKEEDECNPQSAYGCSKRAGEIEVHKANPNAIIIRTSWLYSEFGKNFVTNMKGLILSKPELKVVYDQVGSPTYAPDLADFILALIKTSKGTQNLYHFSNTGITSWYDLTQCIKKALNTKTKISPIETTEYPLPATRPHYSVFNTKKAQIIMNIPYWQESLNICINKLSN